MQGSRSGTVIVCGNAWCLPEDLARAQAIRPGAPIIAVNDAGAHVDCFALFSLHAGRMGRFITAAEKRGRKHRTDFSTHSAGERSVTRPLVDHWWQGCHGVGTSAWSAAKVARCMGFGEIILCGAPIERGPYAGGKFCRDFRQKAILQIYRDYIRGDADLHPFVRSMSGWTKQFLGEPG